MKIKTFLSALILLHLASGVVAQSTTTNAVPDVISDPMNYILLFAGVILISTILVMSRIIQMLTRQMAPKQVPQAKPEIEKTPEKEGIWSKLNRKFISDAVPVEKEMDVMLDHDYDGIRELDNNLPPWWKNGFYITIIFAAIYMLYFHGTGDGKVQEHEYQAQLDQAELLRLERLKEAANNVDESSVKLLTDVNEIASGQKIYLEKCKVCHGHAGEGGVGPNLTDAYWIHGGNIHDIFKTIKYGVPVKGMLAWQSQLTPVQMQQVASFVIGLQGTQPENPKAPQGTLYVEAPDSIAMAPDSSGNSSAMAIPDTMNHAANQ